MRQSAVVSKVVRERALKNIDRAAALSAGRSAEGWWSPTRSPSSTRRSRWRCGSSVDPRQADQNVRGTVVLPNGTGKVARVLVLAKGEKKREAREAGADFVGGDDLIKRIQEENWLDFDRVIATPDIMGAVGRIGKILGPRGLMPNPRVGTVTFDVAKAVSEVKAGKVDYRVDKAGVVHARIGKISFGDEQADRKRPCVARRDRALEASQRQR